MNKELIIILYKINIAGYSSLHTEEFINIFINSCSLRNDEELKENYTIREIFLPIKNGESDVHVIYPVTSTSNYINDLVNNINQKIKDENVSDYLKKDWYQLLRELKFRFIEKNITE